MLNKAFRTCSPWLGLWEGFAAVAQQVLLEGLPSSLRSPFSGWWESRCVVPGGMLPARLSPSAAEDPSCLVLCAPRSPAWHCRGCPSTQPALLWVLASR